MSDIEKATEELKNSRGIHNFSENIKQAYEKYSEIKNEEVAGLFALEAIAYFKDLKGLTLESSLVIRANDGDVTFNIKKFNEKKESEMGLTLQFRKLLIHLGPTGNTSGMVKEMDNIIYYTDERKVYKKSISEKSVNISEIKLNKGLENKNQIIITRLIEDNFYKELMPKLDNGLSNYRMLRGVLNPYPLNNNINDPYFAYDIDESILGIPYCSFVIVKDNNDTENIKDGFYNFILIRFEKSLDEVTIWSDKEIKLDKEIEIISSHIKNSINRILIQTKFQ